MFIEIDVYIDRWIDTEDPHQFNQSCTQCLQVELSGGFRLCLEASIRVHN